MATQAERREGTIGRLLDATIDTLATRGYANTTVAAICAAAGVSQGALFRHFATRLDVVVAATERIEQRHVDAIEGLRAALPHGTAAVAPLLTAARETCRSDDHAAWHEVIVAARTDAELRAAVAPVLRRYEAALHALAERLVPPGHPDPHGATVLVLSVLHAFDSEAVTRRVHASPDVEAIRLRWAVAALVSELARSED